MGLTTRVGMEFIGKDSSKGAFGSMSRSLTSFNGQLLRIAGIGGGLYGLKRMFTAVTEAYMVQEKAEIGLQAALRNTNSLTSRNLESFKRYAAELQKQTIYGDEAILAQMSYALNLGVTADKLEAATKAAIGLAAKFRLDLATSMMLVGRASQGQTQMLSRYGIVLDEALTDQEKFNTLLGIGADSFSLAEAETRSLSGQLAIQSNRWSDIAEKIGGEVAPAYIELLAAIKESEPAISWLLRTEMRGLAELVSRFKTFRDTASDFDEAFRAKEIQAGTADFWDRARMQGAAQLGGQYPKGGPAQRLPGKEQGIEYGVDNPAIGMEAIYGASGRMSAERLRYMIEMRAEARRLAEMQAGGGGGMGGAWQMATQMNARYVVDYLAQLDTIKDATREQIDAVRFMHDKTRREKIMMLEDYRVKHGDILAQVGDAEKMLLDEIERYERSRVNAMDVYRANLQADMEDSTLYMSEKWAQTFQSIESSMGSAFYNMIAEGATFKDAMIGFAQDIARAFARMAAEITARVMMAGVLSNLSGGSDRPPPTFVPLPGPVLGSKQDGGFIPRTGLYQLHANEYVTPAGGGGAPNLIINNNTGVSVRNSGVSFNGRDWVASLVIADLEGGGPISRAIEEI